MTAWVDNFHWSSHPYGGQLHVIVLSHYTFRPNPPNLSNSTVYMYAIRGGNGHWSRGQYTVINFYADANAGFFCKICECFHQIELPVIVVSHVHTFHRNPPNFGTVYAIREIERGGGELWIAVGGKFRVWRRIECK